MIGGFVIRQYMTRSIDYRHLINQRSPIPILQRHSYPSVSQEASFNIALTILLKSEQLDSGKSLPNKGAN